MQHQYTTSKPVDEKQIQLALSNLNQITNVFKSEDNKIIITMSSHVTTDQINTELSGISVSVTEDLGHHGAHSVVTDSNWLIKYQPLLIVFSYILLISFVVQMGQSHFDLKTWIVSFMGFWFVIFSLFKMIDLAGFATGYAQYDIISKYFPNWGFIYPFVELTLGVLHLQHIFSPQVTGLLTLLVMGTAIIGVVQKMIKGERIQCACLGTIFKAPLTYVTLIEDALMIFLALFMIIFY